MILGRNSLMVIGYSLCILYGTSFLIYFWIMAYEPFRIHSFVLSFLFFILFFSSWATMQFKEWGRRTLILANGIALVYQLALYSQFADFIQPSYLFMHGIVVLFFGQKKIVQQFKGEWQFKRKSILIVDDDEGLQKTVQKILLPRGYSVLTATSGEKGLQIAKLQKPDLIVLDVILPGIKGRDVCAQLKQNHDTKSIPVIFLTAKDSEDDIKAELAAGGISHLTKPVSANTLLVEIKKILG